jgi:ATP-binding cassette subfamily A (ABC1) protein 1
MKLEFFFQMRKVDYSITQTTLDDVFVRFARLQRETIDDMSEGHL